MKNPPFYIRDLSWLKFNERVMQEAKDDTNSLLDRLKFLGIFSNNQDEFFRVRVATLTRMKRLGRKVKMMQLLERPDKILKKVSDKVRIQSRQFDRIYAEIIREMAMERVYIKNEQQLSPKQERYCQEYFSSRIRTQIVPLMIESISKMPLLRDKSQYLACVLGSTEHTLLQRYSLIEIPSQTLPRFVLLPSEEGGTDLILMEDIIRFSLPQIFAPFGFNRFLGYIIKVTRDAEFELDDDMNANLIEELEQGIKNRKKGQATRFVYDKTIDSGLLEYLTQRLKIGNKDSLIAGGRIHNFKDFMQFPESVFHQQAGTRSSFMHPLLMQPCRIMEVIARQDVLLHFPYHSFDPLIDLLREAAVDPFVQSIKMTCYRVAKDSKVMNALVNAVRNGKKVTAVLELRARFDEAANLAWKEQLEEEGVQVVLGIPNMKVHAKLCIIKKREFNHNMEYGFISTGNFNEDTARFYGDHCLLTANKRILADVKRIFAHLENPSTNMAPLRLCKTLLVAPTNMRDRFGVLIQKEIDQAKAGQPSGITVKLNSLSDESLICALYAAAEAGVSVRLIVRGIFCAVPRQKVFKKQIKAISIVDEYLEHARVFVFHNKGHHLVYISSADWMVRNLDHRVEAACPILDPKLRRELMAILELQLSDNEKARILDNEQNNEYAKQKENTPVVRSQVAIAHYLKEQAAAVGH